MGATVFAFAERGFAVELHEFLAALPFLFIIFHIQPAKKTQLPSDFFYLFSGDLRQIAICDISAKVSLEITGIKSCAADPSSGNCRCDQQDHAHNGTPYRSRHRHCVQRGIRIIPVIHKLRNNIGTIQQNTKYAKNCKNNILYPQ